MNKVICNHNSPPVGINAGDIFRDSSGTIYVLSRIRFDRDDLCYWWTAVSISNGHYWKYPEKSAVDAVEGLNMVGRGLEIIIN